jgi:hypothetical protein
MTDTADPTARKDSVLTDVSQLLRDAETPTWEPGEDPKDELCFATITPTYTLTRTHRKKVLTEEFSTQVSAERAANGEPRIMMDGVPSAIDGAGYTVGSAKKLIAALAQVVAAAEQEESL